MRSGPFQGPPLVYGLKQAIISFSYEGVLDLPLQRLDHSIPDGLSFIRIC